MKNISLIDSSFYLDYAPAKNSGRFILLILCSLFLMFSACKKDSNDPETPPPSTEYVITTSSGTIGANGGTVTLSDGATINVEAGALSSDIAVTFNKIGNESSFAADNRSCYEIKGLPAGIKVSLTFPCEKNKPVRHVGVYNYDPESELGTIPEFSYDPVEGKITVDNYTSQKKMKTLDPAKYTRWIMEWSDDIGIGNDAKIIAMPYYEQVSQTCWAADGLMLSESYLTNANKESNESSIAAFMKFMDLDINSGINMNIFKRLKAPFELYSGGHTAKIEQYYWTDNLLKKIIEKIKEDKPVILFMPNLGHAVMVVGYRSYTNTTGYDEWELVIHDSKGTHPPSADEGGMYTTRKWSWFISTYNPFNRIGILYSENPVSPERSLQTVIMPSSEQPQSYITFNYKKNVTTGTIYLKYDETSEFNHKWVNSADMDVDTLPQEVTKMNLKLQIYNADWDPSFFNKNGIVEVTIFNRDKNETTYQKEFIFGMPSESQIPVYVTQSIDTSEWYRPFGDTNQTNYMIRIRLLNESKTYLDGFPVFFTMKNRKPDLIKVGSKYQGGIIGYVLKEGDPGYDPKVPHGLIVANPGPAGVSMWGCRGTAVGTTEAGLGTGASNTEEIAASCQESMAKICSDLVINGYSDWYMPSIGELNVLFENRVAIGCIADGWYFSSTEYSGAAYYPPSDYVFGQNFPTGAQQWLYKENLPTILAIRSF